MKLTVSKNTLSKLLRILKWTKIVAKVAAIGTAISGAVTALSGSITTGMAAGAAGATTYAVAKGVPTSRYEKTKHVPPAYVNRTANILHHQETEKPMSLGKQAGLLARHHPLREVTSPPVRIARRK